MQVLYVLSKMLIHVYLSYHGKVPGIGVTSEMIKYANPMWLSYLRQLFNVCTKCAVLPNDLKCAIIVPSLSSRVTQ
jgi:hypothetical protein